MIEFILAWIDNGAFYFLGLILRGLILLVLIAILIMMAFVPNDPS